MIRVVVRQSAQTGEVARRKPGPVTPARPLSRRVNETDKDGAEAARSPSNHEPVGLTGLLAQAMTFPPVPLPHLAELEAHFAQPLAQIPVYANPVAAQALALAHAEALTYQGAIFLADPHPSLVLITHEVVHALQMQSAAAPMPNQQVVAANDPAEHEAATLADQVERTATTALVPPHLTVTTTLPATVLALRRTTPPSPTTEPATTAFQRTVDRMPQPSPPSQTAESQASAPQAETLPVPALEPDQPPLALPPAPVPGISEAEVAAQQAAMVEASAALSTASDPEALMAAFADAPPTLKAQSAATLGADTDRLAKAEVAQFNADVPDIHATLTSVVEEPPPLTVVSPDIRPPELTVEGTLPRGEVPSTPDPGRYTANDRLTADVSRLMSGTAEDRATQIAEQLRSVQVQDDLVVTSPGVPPQIPLTDGADPEQIDNHLHEGVSQSRQLRDEAAQAVINGPGPEQAQPVALDEAYAVGELIQPTIAAPTMPEGPQAYLELGLPPDVQVAFDQQQQAAMVANMAAAHQQVVDASAERDQQQAAAISEAQTQAQEQSAQADARQRDGVMDARNQIQSARQETLAAQQAAVADVEQQATVERTAQRRQVDERVRADEEQITQQYATAERDAQAEVADGERQAAAERDRATREAEEQSWWDRAVNAIRDAFAALTRAIGAIFDAVRRAVNAILDAAKAFAMRLIDAAVSFINGLIAAFGAFLKGLIDTLIGSIFPELAARLNAAIDNAVAFAQNVVNTVAATLKAGIAAIVEGLRAGLNAIINAYQAALTAALSVVQAVLTGDWAALARMALEAVLKVAGVDPETFYQFIGRAQETFQMILDNPGGFVSNLVDAFLNGVRQFADNFLSHLQAGIIGWLTGALGGAGITLPERFDLMGVLSLIQQILGLTWERLRERAVRLIGPQAVAMIEFVAGYLQTLIEGGWDALWQRIRDDLAGLRDMVFDSIKNFLLERIVMAAITRLATMFNPVGAIVNLIIAAYNLFTFLRDQLARIIEVVQTVVNAIGDIARGVIQPAAQRVEEVLARLLPLAIDLLARLLGLGNVGRRVREIIEQVRAVVDRALDRLIERVRGMFRGGGDAASTAARPSGELAIPFTADGQHHLYVRIINGRAVMTIASQEQDFDQFAAGLEQRIQVLPEGPDKNRLLQQLAHARQLSTTVETRQTQAATRAAQERGGNIQSQLDQLIAALSAVMVRASNVPPDFTPGVIQYNPQGDRAKRAHGWLGKKQPRDAEDQARVSRPVNDAIRHLADQGVSINTQFDAGHLIASRYGGDGRWHNLVPMEARMNRSWFSAFEARVQTHVDADEAVYADVEAQYRGNPFARLLGETEITQLTAAQQVAAATAFECIPQAIVVSVGRRSDNGRDQPLFNLTFDPRLRLSLTIGQSREGLVGQETVSRARDVFQQRDEE
ncbi:DNA/RNA non-specific endonuclease [Chloroflexus sp.]|uniref:DNA/RNA non-specific endonuclease n=1 Tax=Chloroflexus sp. TaxID=1904827 RepID=UPI002ADE1A65|nr:DNA/RNA non-specific endonuclease [Chloroflexus sp.]